MSDSPADRIHEATPTRLQQARRDGNVAKSFELAAAAQMIGAIAASFMLLGQVGRWVRNWTLETWSSAGSNLNVDSTEITQQVQNAILGGAGALLPFLGALAFIGFASHWFQTGPLLTTKRIVPDPGRLASGNWRQHVFSISSLTYVIVGIPKTMIALTTLIASCWFQRNDFFALAHLSVDNMTDKLFQLILTVTFHVVLALLATSAIDFWLKFLGHKRRLRMTDQQLRDELRMQNGDPQLQARRQRMSRVE